MWTHTHRNRKRHRQDQLRCVVLAIDQLVAHQRPRRRACELDLKAFKFKEPERAGRQDRNGAGDRHIAQSEFRRFRLSGDLRAGRVHEAADKWSQGHGLKEAPPVGFPAEQTLDLIRRDDPHAQSVCRNVASSLRIRDISSTPPLFGMWLLGRHLGTGCKRRPVFGEIHVDLLPDAAGTCERHRFVGGAIDGQLENVEPVIVSREVVELLRYDAILQSISPYRMPSSSTITGAFSSPLGPMIIEGLRGASSMIARSFMSPSARRSLAFSVNTSKRSR